jgi:predicted RNA-binding protein (virulence factor B family)
MEVGDKVALIIGHESPLGYAVLIDASVEGLLYRNEVFQKLHEGQSIDGYVKKIREDGKIDVALQPQNFKKAIGGLTERILENLELNDGSMNLTDKSSPDEIREQLQMSKKNFKKAIGILYKEKKIELTKEAIVLLKK